MRIRTARLLATLTFLLAGEISQAASASPRPADVIYFGGDIVTLNDAQPAAEAVAVADGHIVAVGKRSKVMKFKGKATRVVNLAGRTLIPGIFDPHGHLYLTGLMAASANLMPSPDGLVEDIPSLQRTLKAWAERNHGSAGKTGWIIGFGYDDSMLAERRPPTRTELDAVSTEAPIFIIHQSGHLAVLNSKALELMNITAATTDPVGGVIRRQPGSREPDGVLEEQAMLPVAFKVLGAFDAEDNRNLLQAGLDLYLSYGHTTIQEAGALPHMVNAIEDMAKRKALPVDVLVYPYLLAARNSIAPPALSGSYQNHYRIGGVKIALDGSPQGKTAWLSKPYLVPPPGQDALYSGYAAMSDEKAFALVDEAFANHWQLIAHANGDAAIDQLIRAVRAANEKHGKADRRPVAIHAQTARRDQVKAFKEEGILPAFFPTHTFYWGDWHRDSVLGPERAANISPLGWAIENNMTFTSHHDSPVVMPDAMRVLAASVNRTTRTGRILGPQHRISPLIGLKAQTIWAAKQHFEEKSKGTIEVGKLADFAILSENPLEIDPSRIANIAVEETIKEGQSVYRRGSVSAGGRMSCGTSRECRSNATHLLAELGIVLPCQHLD